jgi:hypothetical protein
MRPDAAITRAELARMIDDTLLEPGATRLGTSHTVAILNGVPDE